MKLSFTIFIVLFCFQWTCAQEPNKGKAIDFDKFVNLFPKIELPYSSKGLNSIGYSEIEKRFKVIPQKLALKYICNGKDAEMQFPYKIYNMEDGTLIQEGLEKYKYCAVFKLKLQNCYLIAYPKIDTLLRYILKSIDFQGKTIDNITINEINGETEYIYYKASIIDNNLNLLTFEYEANADYIQKKTNTNEMSPRSFITISTYRINQLTGKFEFVDKKKKNSKFSVDDFASSNNDCQLEDPINIK